MQIQDIDRNFKVETKIEKDDIRFFNVREEPFAVYGVFHEDGKFRRMPEAVARTVSEGVTALHTHTAGGRIRFRTDSPYIAIHAKMESIYKMPHFAISGSAGFDLYISESDGSECFERSFMPPFNMTDGYESVVELGSARMREITVNMPLYSGVSEVYIGLANTATLAAPLPYRIEKPIVFYGSSITQGGCASRPGSCYTSITARYFGANHINLGFSGNAKAEDEIAEYISGLDMSAFVYDYDHNTPSIEHLIATHEKMFKKIREQNPELPIVIMSMPRNRLTSAIRTRRDIIKKTYENAVAAGDKNVYFIDGSTLLDDCPGEGTVDCTHPTDLGFFFMAKAVIRVLEGVAPFGKQ